MNPFKKSIIGSVVLLTSIIMFHRQYRDNEGFEIFSVATIFFILGLMFIYYEYGNDNEKSNDESQEEE